MKEWIVLQGWPMYLMLGMTVLGVLGDLMSRLFYGRLAREAQLCGTSDYPMLHYIRQKYSSYYKLGMRPSNGEALVKRYLALHKVGILSLYGWPEVRIFMMGAIVMVGVSNGLYQYLTTAGIEPLITNIGTCFILSLGLWLIGRILNVQRCLMITENAICDYLENYLKSKLDGEYGYGPQAETPDHYAKALKETAAARTKAGIRPAVVRSKGQNCDEYTNHEVDARIVEDVLKEFLG